MADNNSTRTPGTAATDRSHSSKIRYILLGVFIAAALIGAFFWWRNYSRYITTDDANLDSYRIDVAPMVSGQITRLYVQEGDSVKKGDPLFELDKIAMTARLEEAQAQYKQLLAQLEADRTNLAELKNNLKIAQLAEKLSLTNYERAKKQLEGEAITLEAYQNLEEAWKSAKLQTLVAGDRIQSAIAQTEATRMSAEASLANVATMHTNLGYYHVTAPADGTIGKRWCLPGDVVNAGQTILTLNQGNDMWVSVFLEETKYSHIFYGQEVRISLDAYPNLSFYGKIYYIGDNAASEFALVPPNNASGNYTKVTQRIPLKISIDRIEGDTKQKEKVRLVSGMSATVKIEKDK